MNINTNISAYIKTESEKKNEYFQNKKDKASNKWTKNRKMFINVSVSCNCVYQDYN